MTMMGRIYSDRTWKRTYILTPPMLPSPSYTTNVLPHSDYAANDGLDRYSEADINDAEDFEDLSLGQRRAAEAAMARRDRLERGGNRRGQRAANRSRMPNLLSDDDEDLGEGLIPSGARRRARRTYEERRDLDDMEGVEDVSPRLELSSSDQTLNSFSRVRNFRWSNSAISRRSLSWSGLRTIVFADPSSNISETSL